MCLGEKINLFDNSKGTTKEFNEIFKETPILKYYECIEIGKILMGAGNKREIFLDGTRKVFTFSFTKKLKDNVRKDRKKTKSSKYKILVEKGDKKLEFGTVKECSEFFGITNTGMYNNLAKHNNTIFRKGYTIKKVYND